ncbi:hypothetical protein Tco_1565975 [Tanacetum coccineum]
MDREVKRLKRIRIPLIKFRWNSKRGPEFTWEREDQFKKKYPHLFTKNAPSSSAASLVFIHPITLNEAIPPMLPGNGYPEKDEKQSQKRQNWARNGIV